MDVDGPCAFPRPSSIEESVAGPLSVIGAFLIFLSVVLVQMFLITEDLDRLGDAVRRHENSNHSFVEVKSLKSIMITKLPRKNASIINDIHLVC